MASEIVRAAGDGALSHEALERLLMHDVGGLSPAQRVEYYLALCSALELDPRTKPFEYLQLKGRLVLYARAAATQQIAAKRGVSFQRLTAERVGDLWVVTGRATTADGRYTEAVAAVPLVDDKGDPLPASEAANAVMKADTKWKRRAVLELCGLGVLDETELDTVRGARPVRVDTETGEILDAPAAPAPAQPAPSAAERAVRRSERGTYAAVTGAERCAECGAPAGKAHASRCSRRGGNGAPAHRIDREALRRRMFALYAERCADQGYESDDATMRRHCGAILSQALGRSITVRSRAELTEEEMQIIADWLDRGGNLRSLDAQSDIELWADEPQEVEG